MPRMPVPSPYSSPPAIVSVRLSHLVTASLNSTGLGSLSTDLPAHFFGLRSQKGGLGAPAPPLSERVPEGNVPQLHPACLSSRKKGECQQWLCSVAPCCWQVCSGTWAVRGGGEGRGSAGGMGMGRPRAGAEELPPVMPCAYGCTSLRAQISSRPEALGCPRSLESRWSKSVPAMWRGGKGLESAAARSTGGARAPPLCFVAGGGTAAGRAVLSPKQPGQRAPRRCWPKQRLLFTRPRPPAHPTSLGLQDLGPKGCPLQHWTDQLYPCGAGAVPTSPELECPKKPEQKGLQRPYPSYR